ncbi:hypothetical protein OPV22_007099 [Ensete ventricosum]|uniref:GST C-terminal domain-containing protein n=1 Tax=Ensete ventricosum TaxID=4639 RepID=A0AAV8RR22_ENSVE|nr:hypothetical protein OPV22_007099 [Ensete ventricosum]
MIPRSKKKLDNVLNIYEQRLGETKFPAVDRFALVDLSHLPVTSVWCRRISDARSSQRGRMCYMKKDKTALMQLLKTRVL